MTCHILTAISAHGFGHLAQVAPIINACQRLTQQGLAPEFELTFRSTLPRQQIAARVQRPFHLDRAADDFGMVMHDALRVDLVQSLQRYAHLHQHWNEHVHTLANHLQRMQLTGLLADAPYLTLAAAKAANIPSIAICSLNWADILEACVRNDPGAVKQAGVSQATLAKLLQQMRDAYGSTAVVIRPEPAIDTSGFKTITVEPLTNDETDSSSNSLRAELLSWLKAQTGNYLASDHDCVIVLTSMGGIDLPLHPERWPTECLGRKVVYLMDGQMTAGLPHAVGFDLDRFDFRAMMASCNVVLTKPGYGMFVETRVNRKPMLYLERDQWPESECLMKWAHQQMHACKISLRQLANGDFLDELSMLLQQPIIGPAKFNGAEVAARLINQHLLSP